VLGGAMPAEDSVTRKGSLLIINVPSREDAKRFSENEPFTNPNSSGGLRSTACAGHNRIRLPHRPAQKAIDLWFSP